MSNKSDKGILKKIISGKWLKDELNIKQVKFILFISILGIIYITNRYNVEKILVESHKIKKEIKELHSEYVSITSKLMKMTKESEIRKMINKKELSLKVSDKPPYKIIYTAKKKKD